MTSHDSSISVKEVKKKIQSTKEHLTISNLKRGVWSTSKRFAVKADQNNKLKACICSITFLFESPLQIIKNAFYFI